jgi:hypothetical protein
MGTDRPRIWGLCLFLAWIGLSGISGIQLPNPFNPPPSHTVQGEILRIEGDLFVLRGSAEPEIRLRVDDNTVRLDTDRFQVGDVVIADVTPEGHAITITTLDNEHPPR